MRQKHTDMIVIAKEDYDALAKSLARAHLINLKYQANCKCNIDLEDVK